MKTARCPTPPLDEMPSRPASESLGESSSFLAAVQFLTTIPVGNTKSPDALRRCAKYFPLVGALVGTAIATLIAAAGWIWPLWLAVLIGLVVETLLTGALHEDALADFCDAFGGGWSRQHVLAILKDSRVGTYGAVALVLGLALRAGATYELVEHAGLSHWQVWFSAIVASAVLGRWTMLYLLVRIPPIAGRESLTRQVGADLRTSDLLLGSLWCLIGVAPFAFFMPKQFTLSLVLSMPIVALLMLQIQRKLGGVTGDCLGCTCFVTQALILLAAAARLG
jgi:adenosylcobinamide-GDP ribazoletransferase